MSGRARNRLSACACCEGGIDLSRIADGVDECRRAARDELRKGATQIKILASGGVASPYDPIWNLQYSERGGARDRRGSARLAHLRDGARLFARSDPPLDRFRRALDRARQSDRPRHRRARRRRRRLCRADARHLRRIAPPWPRARLSRCEHGQARRGARGGAGSLEILQAAGVKIGYGTDLLGRCTATSRANS